ncbi:MAG: PQQ-binding-like beta-propeller repeat protein [Sedimentisphaerales bacterium]
MTRMLKCRFVLLSGLLVLCIVQNSFAGFPQGGVPAQGSSQWLVSPKLLEHANLKMLWENKLPIKNTERLEQLFILGNRLYAISNQNYTASLNRENGNMIFGRIVAPDGLPVEGLKLYDDVLISIAGTKVIEIDPQSGDQRKSADVGFSIACPPARNSSFFYLSGIDKRLHILRAEDKVQIFEVAVENESMITSIIAEETFVIFAAAAGNVVSIMPDKPRRLWQFDAAGGIAGPIIKDGISLFFASKDTNVYRVDIVGLPLKNQLAWKYQTDGVLDKAPRVTQGVVYQYVPGKGVTAIDKGGGTPLWSVPGGADLLAEAKEKAYVITKNGTLVVMDNLTAKKLYSVNFAEVSRYAANIADSKIYIADERGRIACLQPAE